MSQARDFADSFSAVSTGRRNLIINGAMQVSQRGTSFSSVTASAYHLDRFQTIMSNDATLTVSQSTESPEGFSSSLKMDVTVADTSIGAAQYAEILHRIEAQNLQHLQYGASTAKTITLSFWVKSSKTGTYCVSFSKSDATRYDYPAEYTINSADTWEKKTITVEPDSNIKASSGAIANDTGDGIIIKFILAAGTNRHGTADTWTSTTPAAATSNQVNWLDSTSNNFYLTGVQLEVGNSASPFEHRSYSDELQACRRYFYKAIAGGSNDNYIRLCNGSCHSTTQAQGSWHLPVEMRTQPTLSAVGANGDYAIYESLDINTCTSAITIGDAGSNKQVIQWQVDSSGLTDGNGCQLICNNKTTDASIDFNAEL